MQINRKGTLVNVRISKLRYRQINYLVEKQVFIDRSSFMRQAIDNLILRPDLMKVLEDLDKDKI